MTYPEFFGLWLNRKRAMYRRAWSVMFGSMVAQGAIEPSLEFCRANADGEGEALLLKMQFTRSS